MSRAVERVLKHLAGEGDKKLDDVNIVQKKLQYREIEVKSLKE